MEFYIYFPDKGWWTKSASYSTQMDDVQTFSLEDATLFCKLRYDKNTGVVCFPVNVANLKAIAQP